MPVQNLEQESENATKAKYLQLVSAQNGNGASALEGNAASANRSFGGLPRHWQKRRFTAFVFDFLVLHGFSLGMAMVCSWFYLWSSVRFGSMERFQSSSILFEQQTALFLAFWLAILVPVSLVYFVGSVHFFGRSVGQSLLGLRVVDERWANPSFLNAHLRYVLFLLSCCTFGIDFLLHYRDPKGQFGFEKWSGTKVVKEN